MLKYLRMLLLSSFLDFGESCCFNSIQIWPMSNLSEREYIQRFLDKPFKRGTFSKWHLVSLSLSWSFSCWWEHILPYASPCVSKRRSYMNRLPSGCWRCKTNRSCCYWICNIQVWLKHMRYLYGFEKADGTIAAIWGVRGENFDPLHAGVAFPTMVDCWGNLLAASVRNRWTDGTFVGEDFW